jgi:hypothetical protein
VLAERANQIHEMYEIERNPAKSNRTKRGALLLLGLKNIDPNSAQNRNRTQRTLEPWSPKTPLLGCSDSVISVFPGERDFAV